MIQDPDKYNNLNKHWDSIFSTTNDNNLGWYEGDISQTIKLLEKIPIMKNDNITIFISGAGTSLLADELLNSGHTLILNDISNIALDKLKNRIGNHANIIWLHHDIAKPLPEHIPEIDIWIDRAVLHFLLSETAINGYFSNLNSAIKPGGYVLLAEFSITGATKCAGLDLHRYSIEEMTERMGSNFRLVHKEDYSYINPHGEPRPYIYALFIQNNPSVIL